MFKLIQHIDRANAIVIDENTVIEHDALIEPLLEGKLWSDLVRQSCGSIYDSHVLAGYALLVSDGSSLAEFVISPTPQSAIEGHLATYAERKTPVSVRPVLVTPAGLARFIQRKGSSEAHRPSP